MTIDIKHITEISRSDLRQIAAAANLHGGDGIDVTPTDAGLEISIDLEFLAMMVKRIIQRG